MKRIVFTFSLILAVVLFSSYSHSASIDVMSQLCSADIYYYDWSGGDITIVNWSGSDPTGISGPSGVSASATTVGKSTSQLEAYTGFLHEGYVSAEILFRPIGASYITLDNIVASSSGTAYASLMLTDVIDVNTEKTLFQIQAGYSCFDLDQTFPGLIPNGLYVACDGGMCSYDASGKLIGPYDYPLSLGLIPVAPSHTYSLKAYSWVLYSDAASISCEMSLVAVPEPATILLLCLGLIGLGCVRRKFKY